MSYSGIDCTTYMSFGNHFIHYSVTWSSLYCPQASLARTFSSQESSAASCSLPSVEVRKQAEGISEPDRSGSFRSQLVSLSETIFEILLHSARTRRPSFGTPFCENNYLFRDHLPPSGVAQRAATVGGLFQGGGEKHTFGRNEWN
ncbi:hypothetical protein CEXT_188951 [Caerostris extrusa]|uniref:Uncharacterized protein n=1 Tax=Caerostris extrusa TaxID=172846 RepID=A0AAV4NMX6_CAEEX|nr:hypothetical protein CEXT_188951 [Caerostris extrusa]